MLFSSPNVFTFPLNRFCSIFTVEVFASIYPTPSDTFANVLTLISLKLISAVTPFNLIGELDIAPLWLKYPIKPATFILLPAVPESSDCEPTRLTSAKIVDEDILESTL